MPQFKKEDVDTEAIWHMCLLHGTDPYKAKLIICEKRKAGYLLDVGRITDLSRCSFIRDQPTPSYAHEREQNKANPPLHLCLHPPGFKMLVTITGRAYMGEVVYGFDDDDEVLAYRFHRVLNRQIETSSPLCLSPTEAFGYVSVSTAKERVNGKMLVGVGYSAIQNLLRDRFKDCVDQVPAKVRDLFIKWLRNKPLFKANPTRTLTEDTTPKNKNTQDEKEQDDDNMSIVGDLEGIDTVQNEDEIKRLAEFCLASD